MLEKLNIEFTKAQDAVEKSALGVVLFLSVDGERELIANTNADKKISYINKVYNKDLRMIVNNNIVITGWRFFVNREQVDITLHTPNEIPIKHAIKDEEEGE